MFFTEFAEFSDKKIMTLKGLEPATQPPTSCVGDQHATTVPAGHM